MMNETLVTVVGNVATDPQLRVTTGGRPGDELPAGVHRAALRQGLSGGWRDGDTTFWQRDAAGDRVAENVVDSLEKGQPVVVHGRLRRPQLRGKDGSARTSLEIDAFDGRPRPQPRCRQFTKGDRPASRGVRRAEELGDGSAADR